MEGSDVILRVKGFPLLMTNFKIKIFLKQQVKCEAGVTKAQDGTVRLHFHDVNELQKFLEADPKTVTWGQDTFNLEYQGEETGTEKDDSDDQEDDSLLHAKTSSHDNSEPDGASAAEPTPQPPVPLPRQRSYGSSPQHRPAGDPVQQVHSQTDRRPPKQQFSSAGRSLEEIKKDRELWRRHLFVSNIPQYLCSNPALHQHFQRFGPTECTLSNNRRFAFVNYFNHNDALKAIGKGCNAGPGVFMNITWNNKEVPQELMRFHDHRHGPHPGFSSYDDPHRYGSGDRRFSAEGYPQTGFQIRQRGPRNRPPRPMSCTDIPQCYGIPAGMRPEVVNQQRGRTFFIGDQPQPLMEISVDDPNAQPQAKSGRQKQRARKKKEEPGPHVKNRPDANTLYQNVHSWTDLKDFCPPGGSKCILAQNFDPAAERQTVQMHFESQRRSGGGPVKNIIKMIDGLLVVFQNENDCDTCINTLDQKVEGIMLKIFLKRVPVLYERKFIIKNVAKGTTEDVLKMFLERCTKEETPPMSCVKQSLPGVYLVEYDGDFDVAETDGFMTKVASEALQGNWLLATRLLHSDCLKVSEIPSAASDDEIRLMFESKRRTNGGPVTKVERFQDGTALVYFANFEDAERIYNRFKQPCVESIVIKMAAVTVELYHHSLSKEHKEMKKKKAKSGAALEEGEMQSVPSGPAGTLSLVQLKPKCHEKVFFFIKDSKTHYKLLRDRFAGIARVDLCNTAKDGRIVKFSPDKKEGSQSAYEKQCKNRFDKFVGEYSSMSKKLDKDKLEKARSLKTNPLLDKMSSKNADDDFIVRWQNTTVEVTGLKDIVTSKIADIENAVEYETKEISNDEEGYRILVHCGIVDKLCQKYSKASIVCDKDKHSVIINGPEGDMQQMQIEALTMRTTVKSRKIAELDDCARKYLIDNAAKSQSKIQQHLSGNHIKAEFGFDNDEIYVRSRSQEEHKKAVDIIRKMIVVETMKTSGPKADVVRSPPWKGFQQEIQKNGNFGLFVKPDNSIVMVGLQSDIRILRTKIDVFLDVNAIKRHVIAMTYGQARFVLERYKLFQPSCKERQSLRNCGTTPEQGGGVFLEGTQQNIQTAHLIINEMLYAMLDRNHVLQNPGIRKYYLEGDGKEFIERTSRHYNCIVLLDTPSCPEWVQFNSKRTIVPSNTGGSSVDSPNKCLVSAKLGHVTLSVWKVDIIQHRCDVIINTSNKELQLLPGGVSGVIKKIDVRNANQIQHEMNQIIQGNYGHLTPGDAVITRAGNLPNCRKIVHVVGPRWTDDFERRNQPDMVLKSCVRGSLKKTEEAKLTSIAIPAISCGVFGGKPNVCIPLIYDAVLDYFKQEKLSCIKKVYFVELSNDNVLNEFKKVVLKIGGATVKRPSITSQPTPRARPSVFPTPSVVTLVTGDIAQQQVNAVVNIMAPNHIQDMRRGSTIAKALSAAAGMSVVNDCARKSGMYNVGDVFVTDVGSLPCNKIFHALVGSYGQGSEKIVKMVVKECLQLTSQLNFRSIAFPAIGTGGFNHPPDKVARWMNEAITKHAANNLNVSIVLYPSNQAAITAFNAEFHGTPTQGGVLSSSVTYGSLTISVTQGDITQQHVDAIVNSTNSSFDLTQGMISQQIVRQGGSGIQKELANANGEIAVTSGGRLPCKHILHLVTPTDEDDLQKKIVNLLGKADSMNLASLAIPALGTGNIKMDSSKVGLLFRAALQSFVQLYPMTQSLTKVDVVIFDVNMIQDFKDALLGDISTKKSKFAKFKKLVDGFVGMFTSSVGKESPQEILNLYLYAACKNDIENALGAIKNETNKVMHKELIDDPILSSITAMERFEIEEFQKLNSVTIENKSDMYLTRLQVVGLTKDVMKACESIRSTLRKLSEAKTCVQYIAWEKLNSNKQWTELPARVAHALEKAYTTQKIQGKLGCVKVDEFQYDKIIVQTYDLSTMDSQSPEIRRRLKEGESDVLPSSWDAMGKTALKQVVLQTGTAEYSRVLASLKNTGLTGTIQSIERIQSVTLYKQYAAKKEEVTEKLQTTNHQVEMELFHGTTSADKIINNGFDRSFAGTHASAFGDGVYFATTASYSHGYAQPDRSGVRTMFLAHVLTGAYTQGKQGMKTPPTRVGIDLYDSVVNNVNTPSMYIIFKDASAYPTYLIKYT